MPINKEVHTSAATVQGLGEVCLGSIYESTLEKKMDLEHHRPLTDAIKLPPKAQYF